MHLQQIDSNEAVLCQADVLTTAGEIIQQRVDVNMSSWIHQWPRVTYSKPNNEKSGKKQAKKSPQMKYLVINGEKTNKRKMRLCAMRVGRTS